MKTTLVLVLSLALIGAIAGNRLSAQTTGTAESGVPPASTVVTQDPTLPTVTPTTPAPPPTAPGSPAPATPTAPSEPGASVPIATGTATVQNIVEITRMVPSATAVTAFTVPTGVVLVVTDLVVTNTGTAPTCGGAVNRSGTVTVAPTAPTAPTTPAPADSTTAATGSAVTTTVAGTVTQTDSTVTGPLCVPAQTTTTLPLTTGIEFAAGQSVQLINTPDPGGATGSLGFHLRGLLVTLT